MAIGIGRRQLIAALGGAAAAWPFAAGAQQTAMPVIGFLNSLSAPAVARPTAAFLVALKEAGYDDGQNVAIDYLWAEGHYDRLPALAAELVRRRVTVIAAIGGDPAALAAKAATSTIPIVFLVGRDPVTLGLVSSLNRPGGNATGVNLFITEMEAKRIGLLHEMVPAATTLGVLMNPKTADAEAELIEVQVAGRTLHQRIDVVNASDESEIDAAFTAFAQNKAGAILVAADPFFNNRRDLIVTLAARYAIPAVYPLRDFADSGGLISYGTSLTDAYRQAAIDVVRILKGEKPAEIPVVQPTKFEMVINLKTAKTLGLTVPNALLATADEVIE